MEPLSKNTIKLITSLTRKKERDELNLFFAEGPKLVDDLLNTFSCSLLVATSDYIDSHKSIRADIVKEVSKEDLKKASALCAPQSVVAVFRKPNYQLDCANIANQLTLMLDTIQDPGNLGTIIRVADWFGIENILCSKETVDVYNPKVVQATMGALSRVKIHYLDLEETLIKMKNVPIFGTFLEGNNIYEEALPPTGVIIMGNEGNGISSGVGKYVNRKLYIPNFPQSRDTSESLNVAIATAITCSEFRRRINK
ncbi:MAG: RNA methyltransferase [Paludibacteraceae bacterium]|nr:RNA methyltransferase [Paludibacteraceae bacterium]